MRCLNMSENVWNILNQIWIWISICVECLTRLSWNSNNIYHCLPLFTTNFAFCSQQATTQVAGHQPNVLILNQALKLVKERTCEMFWPDLFRAFCGAYTPITCLKLILSHMLEVITGISWWIWHCKWELHIFGNRSTTGCGTRQIQYPKGGTTFLSPARTIEDQPNVLLVNDHTTNLDFSQIFQTWKLPFCTAKTNIIFTSNARSPSRQDSGDYDEADGLPIVWKPRRFIKTKH